MSGSIGFSDQSPSLPTGGGGIGGLGATFTPDLSTGTGTFTIPFDAPNGPNDIGPKLGLRYDTGAGNGPFGIGFSLALPRILRDTSHGYPAYTPADPLLLEGAGPLVDLGGGAYRPQVDGGAWRAAANGAGFRLTDREGWFYDCGTSPIPPMPRASSPGTWNASPIRSATAPSSPGSATAGSFIWPVWPMAATR